MVPTKIKSNYQKFRNSSLRNAIWPIRSFELFKFTPMAVLMFTILLNQNIVRSLKDSLVMTHIGAEIISFIKLWGEMPVGVVFVIVYTKLCNSFSSEKAFRYVISFFLIFFAIFAFFLYPNADLVHPNPELVSKYTSEYPHAKWFITMWGKWTYVLMYIFGELWTVIVFTILFWQLANKITKIEEASRFYPFFSIFGQANCLIAGSVIIYFSSKNHFLKLLFTDIQNETEIMVKSLVTIVLITGVLCLIIQKYIEIKIINPDINFKKVQNKTEKQKLGLFDSLKLVSRSKYLVMIVLVLISYSFAINLIEGLWMFKARQMYPKAEQFITYHGRVLFWTGVVTIVFAILGSSLIRKFGWFSAAILTPAIMLITGVAFFLGAVFEDYMTVIDVFGKAISPLYMIVIIGALQHIFSKGIKYSLYDATKEMAYIPLPDDLKTKGKAASDIVGTKLGKSLGAAIQISIFTIFPTFSYQDVGVFLMFVFFFVCVSWIFAVRKLSFMYNKKLS